MPHSLNALFTACATISQVLGWDGCAFATTAFPAAIADAASPPATEKASGKLLAAKIPIVLVPNILQGYTNLVKF